jgi:hypothetical protein
MVKRLRAKQKAFQEHMKSTSNDTISDLDYCLPSAGITLRQFLMAIRSHSNLEKALFISVDEAQAGTVSFIYHPNRAEEAEALVPILYTFCIHHVGPSASSWFQPGAEATNFGYTWDSENATVVCAADKQCEQLLDFGSEMLEDVANGDPTRFELTGEDGKPFNLQFLIDLEHDPKSQLGGSTVGSFGIAATGLQVATLSETQRQAEPPILPPPPDRPPPPDKASTNVKSSVQTPATSDPTESMSSMTSFNDPQQLKSKITQMLLDGDSQILAIFKSLQADLSTDPPKDSTHPKMDSTNALNTHLVSPAAQSKQDSKEAGGHVE